MKNTILNKYVPKRERNVFFSETGVIIVYVIISKRNCDTRFTEWTDI